MSPSQPRSNPKTVSPLEWAILVTARMAAFMPGASPPVVITPIVFVIVIASEFDRTYTMSISAGKINLTLLTKTQVERRRQVFSVRNASYSWARVVNTPYIIVLVTTPSKAEAEKISQKLLEAKLIACANIIGPVASHFHWAGKVDQAEEFLVLMKSRASLFEELSSEVSKLHSYEVPEILAFPVVAGSKAYLEWLQSSLKM